MAAIGLQESNEILTHERGRLSRGETARDKLMGGNNDIEDDEDDNDIESALLV